MQHIATLGLGSNLGDRERYLASARESLGRAGQLFGTSSLYATEPLDRIDQPDFLNQVVQVRTERDAFGLFEECARIELELGRVRTVEKGPRTIDIDMLFFDQQIIDAEQEGLSLIVPHPRLHLRRFVLKPLAELAPDYRHPVLHATISELLAGTSDASRVTLWKRGDDPRFEGG